MREIATKSSCKQYTTEMLGWKIFSHIYKTYKAFVDEDLVAFTTFIHYFIASKGFTSKLGSHVNYKEYGVYPLIESHQSEVQFYHSHNRI